MRNGRILVELDGMPSLGTSELKPFLRSVRHTGAWDECTHELRPQRDTRAEFVDDSLELLVFEITWRRSKHDTRGLDRREQFQKSAWAGVGPDGERETEMYNVGRNGSDLGQMYAVSALDAKLLDVPSKFWVPREGSSERLSLGSGPDDDGVIK